MNIPQIYLVEPYNAYSPKQKKKHWHQVIEEEALMARIIAEQQARQQAELMQEAKSKTLPPQAPPESVPTIVGNTAGAGSEGGAGSAPGGGGMPAWDFWNPTGDVVNFDRSPATGAGPLTVTFTNLTTTPQFDSYNWEFTLDGVTVTSTNVNPVIVFQTGSVNGAFITASLQSTNSVTGAPGGRSPDVYTIVNYPTVTAAFTYPTTSNVAPFSVSFVNGSTTDSQTPPTLTYRWTFTYTNAAGAATTTTSAVPSGYTRRIDSGSFTASLQATGSYGIASIVSHSFVAPAPTLALSLSMAYIQAVSPSMVTIHPTVTYNGVGTPYGYPFNNFNRWWFGDFTEAGVEYSQSYSGDVSRTYNTRSDAGGITIGEFTASLCLTESIYGIAVRTTQSFYIPMPTVLARFITQSFGNGGDENSYMEPVSMSYTSSVYYDGNTVPTMLWDFGSASFFTTTYGVQPGTTASFGPHFRADYGPGSFTASLQLTGSYGIASLVTQSFLISA